MLIQLLIALSLGVITTTSANPTSDSQVLINHHGEPFPNFPSNEEPPQPDDPTKRSADVSSTISPTVSGETTIVAKSPVTTGDEEEGGSSRPHFEYKYGVSDPLTGDQKTHTESRDGDVVRGQYSFVDSDGSIRTVTYRADAESGFQATVETIPAGENKVPVAEIPPLEEPDNDLDSVKTTTTAPGRPDSVLSRRNAAAQMPALLTGPVPLSGPVGPVGFPLGNGVASVGVAVGPVGIPAGGPLNPGRVPLTPVGVPVGPVGVPVGPVGVPVGPAGPVEGIPHILLGIPGLDPAQLTEADLLLADLNTHSHPLGSHPLLPIHPGFDQPHSHPPFNDPPVLDLHHPQVTTLLPVEPHPATTPLPDFQFADVRPTLTPLPVVHLAGPPTTPTAFPAVHHIFSTPSPVPVFLHDPELVSEPSVDYSNPLPPLHPELGHGHRPLFQQPPLVPTPIPELHPHQHPLPVLPPHELPFPIPSSAPFHFSTPAPLHVHGLPPNPLHGAPTPFPTHHHHGSPTPPQYHHAPSPTPAGYLPIPYNKIGHPDVHFLPPTPPSHALPYITPHHPIYQSLHSTRNHQLQQQHPGHLQGHVHIVTPPPDQYEGNAEVRSLPYHPELFNSYQPYPPPPYPQPYLG